MSFGICHQNNNAVLRQPRRRARHLGCPPCPSNASDLPSTKVLSKMQLLFGMVGHCTLDRFPNGTYSHSFAPNCLRGEQIGALFNSHSFCAVVVDVESLEDLCGRKKGQLCSAIAFGSSLGALRKRIRVNLSWSPQEQRVFEEHLRIDFGGSSGM